MKSFYFLKRSKSDFQVSPGRINDAFVMVALLPLTGGATMAASWSGPIFRRFSRLVLAWLGLGYNRPVFLTETVRLPALQVANNLTTPECDDPLDAEMVFVYEDADLNGPQEEDIVRYSSASAGHSLVDPDRNTTTPDGIAHFSLCPAAHAS